LVILGSNEVVCVEEVDGKEVEGNDVEGNPFGVAKFVGEPTLTLGCAERA